MASNQSVIPSSNFLKLKGFTSSFENWQRPAPNAAFPFIRGKMQKLLTPENSFLRGKKNRFFLLRAAVVFCCSNRVRARSGWSWFCCDVASSSQKPCSHLKCTRKLCHPLGPLVLQKQLQLPQKAASEAGGLLIHCTTSLMGITVPWDTQLPEEVWRLAVQCLPLRLYLQFQFGIQTPIWAYKYRICVIIPADRENKVQKRPL